VPLPALFRFMRSHRAEPPPLPLDTSRIDAASAYASFGRAAFHTERARSSRVPYKVQAAEAVEQMERKNEIPKGIKKMAYCRLIAARIATDDSPRSLVRQICDEIEGWRLWPIPEQSADRAAFFRQLRNQKRLGKRPRKDSD
jgi:hypothetical protein